MNLLSLSFFCLAVLHSSKPMAVFPEKGINILTISIFGRPSFNLDVTVIRFETLDTG